MAPRVDSELLLVGSLPADSADSALRSAAEFFADLVFALPDGETGPRAAWVGYERERLVRPNPGVVVVEETESPTGIPRHAYETPVFGIRPGVTELRWDSWPRIDDAIAGYRVFSALREKGVIPAHLRFQVGLPFPSSALNGFKADFAADYPVAERAFEDLVARELNRLTAAIPPADLAIQWDLAYETQDLEGVLAWTGEGAWERFAGPVTRLTRLIPEEVLVGYHLCYGTFPEWPMYEARDMGLLVRMGNFAVANSGRAVDWLHLAGPRYLRSEDRSFFRPLVDLEPGDARVFLGIVLPIERSRRAAAQARHGIALPLRLRRGDVLRVRPPARRGRHPDHARARARGPHRPECATLVKTQPRSARARRRRGSGIEENGVMGSVPDDPAADRPREWLALPGGGIRPVVSVPGPGGIAELLAYAAWLTRLRPTCRCGQPRLGSGRTCGSAECVAGLRVQEIDT